MLNNRLAVIGKHFGPEPANPDTATPLQRRAYGRSYLATAIEYLQFHDLERAYDCLHKMAVIQPELLVQLETYYELGFGDQPKGARGNFATLEVFKNAAIVQDLLAKIFADPQLANRIKGGKRSAFGQAYLALGLLSYGVRRFAAARHFLLKAIAANIHNLLNRQVMATLLKTLVGSLLFTKLAAESQEGLG
jgi:tetratricopeptide (TPR) repeat protein